MRLFIAVGRAFVVEAALAFDLLDEVLVDGRVFVACRQVGEDGLVEFGEHGLDLFLVDVALLVGQVDALVVFRLRRFQTAEGLFAHGDAVAHVAVLDDVDGQVVDDFGVLRSDRSVGKHSVVGERADAHGILAVFAHVGDHIGNTHDAALERGRPQRRYDALVDRACLRQFVERFEIVRLVAQEFLLAAFPVVAQDAVERLQRDVACVERVEHAHGMHVVVEEAPRVGVVQVVQNAFSRMAERGVSQVVAERDGLGQVFVQAEHPRDRAGRARDELYVKSAAADVVVAYEAEHLGLACIAVVGRHVENLVDIAHEGRSMQPWRHVAGGIAPDGVCIVGAIRIGAPRGAVGFELLDEVFAEIAVRHRFRLLRSRRRGPVGHSVSIRGASPACASLRERGMGAPLI